jgi:hypothetical protein
MAAMFNAMTFETLKAFMTEKGFVTVASATETTFERRNHKDDQLVVVVYSSCRSNGGMVRGCGKDALRVCLVADLANGKRIGLAHARRVNRCGETAAILERLLERMRDMYSLANEMATGPRCVRCGAPRYVDTGRCVRKCA